MLGLTRNSIDNGLNQLLGPTDSKVAVLDFGPNCAATSIIKPTVAVRSIQP
jgi:hypothetical protein